MCDCNCKRGLRGYQGIQGIQGEQGVVEPLVWEDLTPFLGTGWTGYEVTDPLYAYDAVNNLLYLSGFITNTTTADTNDICFTITGLTGTPQSSKTLCYDDENSQSIGVSLNSSSNTASLRYLGTDTNVRIALDSVPVIRLF